LDQSSVTAHAHVERIKKLVEGLDRAQRRGDGVAVRASEPVTPASPVRRLPVPFWATGFYILFAVGLMWFPSRSLVTNAASFHGQRGVTPGRLSGLSGREPSLIARRQTVIRAAEDGSRLFTFRLLAPAAREVLVGGSFNDFTGTRGMMTRGEGGIWEVAVPLRPGRHSYKFKVDGVWILDPTNPEKTPAPRESSLIDVPL
jgi:hypothetical protein